MSAERAEVDTWIRAWRRMVETGGDIAVTNEGMRALLDALADAQREVERLYNLHRQMTEKCEQAEQRAAALEDEVQRMCRELAEAMGRTPTATTWPESLEQVSPGARMTDATPTAEERAKQVVTDFDRSLPKVTTMAEGWTRLQRMIAEALSAHAAQAVAEERERVLEIVTTMPTLGGEQRRLTATIADCIRAGQPGQETP